MIANAVEPLVTALALQPENQRFDAGGRGWACVHSASAKIDYYKFNCKLNPNFPECITAGLGWIWLIGQMLTVTFDLKKKYNVYTFVNLQWNYNLIVVSVHWNQIGTQTEPKNRSVMSDPESLASTFFFPLVFLRHFTFWLIMSLSVLDACKRQTKLPSSPWPLCKLDA